MIEQLRKEWEDADRLTRKEDMVRAAKSGGIALSRGLLALLLIAGAITVAAVAPNIFSAFGRLSGGRRYRTYIHRDSFNREAKALKKQNFVSIYKNSEDEYQIRLTKSGERRALQRIFNEFKIHAAGHWDGRWRIVLFDIPDKHKSAREGFRIKLKTAGFYPLQKSVFVLPYPCEEELEFLVSLYNIGDYIRLVETNRILYDEDLKTHFGLSQKSQS